MSAKRSRDEPVIDIKKQRPSLDSIVKSDEWPVYAHPQGGAVKITPWGCLRQYTDPVSGQPITKFEDSTFSKYAFETPASPIASRSSPLPQDMYDDIVMSDLPPTPQSIHYAPHATTNLELSPSSEAEGYLRDGYSDFHQEQEHYFGMGNDEEYQA